MEFNYNQDFIGVIAPKGSGKTYLVKEILKSIPNKVILDTNDEYDDYKESVITPDEFSSNYFDAFLETLIKEKRNYTIIVDDIDVYTPLKSKLLPVFNANSRHKGLGVIYVSRRPKRLDPVMVQNTDYFFLGYPLLPQDKKYIESLLNFEIKDSFYNNLKQYQFILLDVRNRTQEIVYV